MADQSVSLTDIALAVARLEERLQGLEKRVEDGFSFVRLSFEQVNKRIDDVQGEVRSLRAWMLGMYTPIVAGVVAVLLAYAKSLWSG